MKKLIVIGDVAGDSLSYQEIRSAIEGFLKSEETPNITGVASTPSTIHTAFLISQIVQTEEKYGRPLNTVIFQNTDPRMHSNDALEKANGAEPIIVRLKSGIHITGPNAGYVYSLIKDQIEEIFVYRGVNEEGQFHSRDLYGRISAHLMDALEDDMELEETHTNMIPELQDFYIGHIDNFGNIKTTITHEDLKGKYAYGDMITLKINGVEKQAKYVSNLFGGVPGELVIYPGSSGRQDNRFMEITIWRHFTEKDSSTGIHAFNNPQPGMTVVIK
jgi:hypothetical protein